MDNKVRRGVMMSDVDRLAAQLDDIREGLFSLARAMRDVIPSSEVIAVQAVEWAKLLGVIARELRGPGRDDIRARIDELRDKADYCRRLADEHGERRPGPLMLQAAGDYDRQADELQAGLDSAAPLITDEPGKITKLTGPNSLHTALQAQREARDVDDTPSNE